MKHSDPRLQDLAEAIQGLLCMMPGSGRAVFEARLVNWADWEVKFAVLPRDFDDNYRYATAFTISDQTLHDPDVERWRHFKRCLLWQLAVKMADESSPVPEFRVTWIAGPWIEPTKEGGL